MSPPRFTIEPIERHLVERATVVEEMEHRVEMSPLVRPDEDLADVVAVRRDPSVRDDRHLRIIGKCGGAVNERVREIQEAHRLGVRRTG